MITIDFESEAIEDYPNFPPKPVGVAIKYDDHPGRYYAWGHPEGNNCSIEDAAKALQDAFAAEDDLLFHNARFDMAIMEKFFNMPWGDPLRIHDTMYLLFLNNPLQTTLSLKPSSELLLGLPPDEQSAVRDWLILHGVVPSNSKNWGAHISQAPADIVGPYAIGDVDRTKALYNLLYPSIVERGMTEAYNRERILAPILNQSEAEGIRVDVEALKADLANYQYYFKKATDEIKIALGQNNEEFNIDSGVQLAEALRFAEYTVSDDDWPKTPTGKLSTARDVLKKVITNQPLFQLISYRGALKTIIGTFMSSWLTKAESTGGYLHPRWNQVKGDEYGAKTGRLSSSNPNFQNVPTEFEEVVPEGYPPLPQLRQYVLPDEGQVFVSADFHSQEIRMLGHFAEGAIKEIYDNDPKADIHQVAADIISDTSGLSLTRKHTKIVAFSILYGAGVGTMSERMKVSMSEAGQIKRAYLKVLVGVGDFMKEVENRAYHKEPVWSWGGRELYAPAPVVQASGQIWNKDYVLLNYLIQGSSADQTKQAIIDYHNTKKHGRFLATVHDEICISVSKKHLKAEVALLKAAMEAGEFDIPMRATVEIGANWAEMEEYV